MSDQEKPNELIPPVGFLKDQDHKAMIYDLVQVADGTAQILNGLHEHIDHGAFDNVTLGLAWSLKTIANRVKLYIFEEPIDSSTSKESPQHLAYVLEKQLEKVRAKAVRS